MKDRVPKYPGRVLITPEDGSAAFYATVARADEPVEVGTPINKAALLSDDTAKMLGFTMDDDPTVSDAFRAIRTQITTPKYGKMFKPKVMHWFDNVNVDKNSVFQNTDFTSGVPIATPAKASDYNGTELYLTPNRTKIMINTGTMLYLYSVRASNDITLVTTFELPLTTAVATFKILSADDDGALLFDYKSTGTNIVRYADFISKSLKTVTVPSTIRFNALNHSYNSNIAVRVNGANTYNSFILNVTDPEYLYFHGLSNDYDDVYKFNKNTSTIETLSYISQPHTNTIVGQTTAGVVYTYERTTSPYNIGLGYIERGGTGGVIDGLSGSSSNNIKIAVASDYIFIKLYKSSDESYIYQMYRFASGDIKPVMLRTITSTLYETVSNSIAVGNLLYSYDLTYTLNQSVLNLPDLNIVKPNENYSIIPYFKSYLQTPYHFRSDTYYPLFQIHIDSSYYNGWIIPNTQIAIMPNLGICCFEHFEYI